MQSKSIVLLAVTEQAMFEANGVPAGSNLDANALSGLVQGILGEKPTIQQSNGRTLAESPSIGIVIQPHGTQRVTRALTDEFSAFGQRTIAMAAFIMNTDEALAKLPQIYYGLSNFCFLVIGAWSLQEGKVYQFGMRKVLTNEAELQSNPNAMPQYSFVEEATRILMVGEHRINLIYNASSEDFYKSLTGLSANDTPTGDEIELFKGAKLDLNIYS